ncbi:MAG: SGNH/GDSL hydrolase family protein [Candidatus Scatosoma sp.]
MDITKYDKNFASVTVTSEGKKRYTLPCAPFTVYGGFYDEKTGFVRMDQKAASEVSEGVSFLSKNGAGIRVNFSTDSKTVKLIVEESAFGRMRHMALTGSTGFILCSRDGKEKNHVFRAVLCPEYSFNDTFEVSANLDGELRDYVLYFPLYSSVKSLSVELDGGAYVGEGAGYKSVKPVLYYGSSITQGGCASRADNSYQDIISAKTDTDYINLGFSGSGKAEDKMVDYLAKIDCSIFVCDYDHNAPDEEYLLKTHSRLYKRYREKRPETPVVFVSRPDCAKQADARVEIIRATYEAALKNGDKNVYFVDGRTFFPDDIRERCLVDGCHPTDLGFYCMAKSIGAVVEKLLESVEKSENKK